MTRAELVDAMAQFSRDKWLKRSSLVPRSEKWANLSDADKNYWRMDATAALAAIEAAGMAVVPREATPQMVSAATRRPQPDPEPLMYPAIYRAMIAASPVEARDD
jgi:hypothetical protein